MSTARVDFTRGAAERISRVVRIVEAGNRNEAPLQYGDENQLPKVFRICKFTGAWPIGTPKVVARRDNTSANAITAYNLFASVSGVCEERDCAVAKDGTAWYLVAVQCE
jgi:hypothetical protein